MGGGVSLMEGVEELMTTTILIGRAISSMTFPGMYRIYDFHSKKAPKLKNARSFTFFANDSDEDDDDDDSPQPDPATYAHFFKVVVNGDAIYLEDPLEENEAEETVRRGGNLDIKTTNGPGNFNRGWTSLQMACAYGIDPLVEALVASGADVNAINCYGFSCLHEACHRGYADIVKSLLKNKDLDVAYMPPEEATFQSPFASAPPQSSLGEASRCGFFRIVQLLVDGGAPKDQANRLGWTPLHEACFYHRIETVKTLLLAGADATLRTNKGALPYHLAGLQDIRTMLADMGGPQAVPPADDLVDMVDILTELAMLGDSGNPEGRQSSSTPVVISSGSHMMPVIVVAPNRNHSVGDAKDQPQAAPAGHGHGHQRATHDHKEAVPEEEKLLHSGPALGNLPSLATPSKHSPGKGQRSDVDSALDLDSKGSSSSPFMAHMAQPSRKADDKAKKKKKKPRDEVPADMPPHFLCQLTQKPMSEPVKTIYGNIYDRTAIMQWIGSQGRICPLTGAPLSESDLSPMEDLANEIRQWVLKKSLSKTMDEPVENVSPTHDVRPSDPQGEDLYDF